MWADRKRAEEIMNEERGLWDQERGILKARIKALEIASRKQPETGVISPSGMGYRQMHAAHHASLVVSQGSRATSTSSVDGHSRTVPQESGRNADGTPFYAPAPRNPSRTFDSAEMKEVRVDEIAAPRESAIRVTSQRLRSSDFGSHQELEPISEALKETIDISLIQPELEGVAIKATAVAPEFAAKVLSPDYSPAKLSPTARPSALDALRMSPPGKNPKSPEEKAEENEKRTLQVVCEPVDRRLTMHAGHTPNHSMSKFEFLGGERVEVESGEATPKDARRPDNLTRPSAPPCANDGTTDFDEDTDNGDKPLTGILGLTNESAANDIFLQQLHEKLEEARKSEGASPSSESSSSISSMGRLALRRGVDIEEENDEKDDGPPLRLKPSFNFGKPMGRM